MGAPIRGATCTKKKHDSPPAMAGTCYTIYAGPGGRRWVLGSFGRFHGRGANG